MHTTNDVTYVKEKSIEQIVNWSTLLESTYVHEMLDSFWNLIEHVGCPKVIMFIEDQFGRSYSYK